ncbi:protein kinase family protein [Quillaja saponaria]|uniref:Protein kinase family protein n=1 Tax=Quillaja saponaria TaxID=32244 RepID=A0AAD7LRR8_QUISA|nr:protein kinase family protein [Quillaja saponaria]
MDGIRAVGFPTRMWLIFLLAITAIATNIKHQKHNSRNLASNNPGFISINCGANESHYDDAGIYYQADIGFTDSGINMPISSKFVSSDVRYELRTLRYFPKGRKNCYTLKPGQGRNIKYLVRAVFLYGNYDGLGQPPEFDMYIGVNYWTRVQDTTTEKGMIYTSSTDTVHLCLINTDNGTPFISAIELRTLDNSIYQDEIGGLLQSARRYNLGGSNDIIRYADDIYDRKWLHYEQPDWTAMTPVSFVDISNNTYHIPAKVLGTAVTSVNSSINYTWKSSTAPNYVYFHFTEIEKLQDGKQRKIFIRLDDENMGPFSLDYLKPITVPTPKPLTGKESHSFSISTMDNDLPPILNAYEILTHKSLSLKPTQSQDVDAIMDIKHTYAINEDWQGDPCIPANFSWNGLRCSDDQLTRIIFLDLSFNDLTGPVPESLAQLQSLRILNLTGNKIQGPVPNLLIEKSKNGSLILKLDKYPELCLMGSCNGKIRRKVVIIAVPSTVTVLVLIILLALAIIWTHKRSKKGETVFKYNGGRSLKFKGQSFKYSEIVKITDNFSSLVGEGGFGKVYQGTLKDDFQVAVKLLSSSSRQGSQEFQNEVKSMLRVHHKNLLSLIGYCNEGDNMALLYEYMENGTLEQHLSFDCNNVLTWIRRLKVAIDAARGLDYLHNGCKPSIIHRDIKTSNILLDKNLQAKISDFGLSKALEAESCTHVLTDPKGTFGYLDPQYYKTKKLNRESDIYSFGVVLLEMITGRSAIIRDQEPAPIHIIQWVTPNFGRMDIGSIVDPRIQGSYNISSAGKAIEIAMACVHSAASQRPNASLVYSELKECLKIELALENIIENDEICSNCSSVLSPR